MTWPELAEKLTTDIASLCITILLHFQDYCVVIVEVRRLIRLCACRNRVATEMHSFILTVLNESQLFRNNHQYANKITIVS